MTKKFAVGITGIGSYLPEKIVTNSDIEKMVETSDEWIVARTGIKQRRVVDESTATSDVATKAAEKAIKDAGIDAEKIDLIIVATATADMAFPSTACIVQRNIAAINAAAFDISAACTGFVYALTMGEQFIKTGFYKNALIIGAEAMSKVVDWQDRNTCILFGDGAGAVMLERTEEGMGILASYLGANGEGGDCLTIPAGGSRLPATYETIESRLHCIKMDGSEVFKFAVRVMASAALKALEKSNLSLEEIDFLIPHQANIRIIEAAAKRLKLPMEKVYVNLDQYGNMSAASVPVALDEAVKKGLIKKGDNVVMVAFGGGLTWGSTVLKWCKE
ncbi:3-oxoacyl-[acyl-carrier-protein] synthase 3 [Clostridium aceticum]|uniref:Beta-ketoacyl-[acyl-carrier-protein] synthase III n=1 Tax=Clostridium aceticum TaxID=84022 RepID=A0A0D8I9V4_9CLOT|nr:beta-ketoacyl-ACP synthase III [Clostridium aceticum]AKL95514.1 3-oxoacyl-[acyl-carrier-protein] synthase 3 [Clostridium aceticum]KJF25996.1 3-oxoacyl-ACP synthase [Clostridium aceticum]